jgi:hypothetical protein
LADARSIISQHKKFRQVRENIITKEDPACAFAERQLPVIQVRAVHRKSHNGRENGSNAGICRPIKVKCFSDFPSTCPQRAAATASGDKGGCCNSIFPAKPIRVMQLVTGSVS